MVLKARKREHARPLLWKLHWLPIRFKIECKPFSRCYNSLNGSSPDYVSELLNAYTPSRLLRSSAHTRILRVSYSNLIICDPTSRNESDCYLVTFWVQPISQRGCHTIEFGFSTKSVSPVVSTSEKYTSYTHKECISVISKCLKQTTLQ